MLDWGRSSAVATSVVFAGRRICAKNSRTSSVRFDDLISEPSRIVASIHAHDVYHTCDVSTNAAVPELTDALLRHRGTCVPDETIWRQRSNQ